MQRYWIGLSCVAAVLVTGCATKRTVKPLLTAKASERIGRKCGSVRSEFYPGGRRLPYASYVLKPEPATAGNGPSPVVACLTKELARYQRDMLAFSYDSMPVQ